MFSVFSLKKINGQITYLCEFHPKKKKKGKEKKLGINKWEFLRVYYY